MSQVAAGAPPIGRPGAIAIHSNRSVAADFCLFLLIVIACDWGVLTEADGVMCAAAIALVRPALLPYLVLLVAGFQDAKGLSGQWWYGGTLGLGAWLMLRFGRRIVADLQQTTREFRVLLALAIVTVLYGVASSYLQDSLGVHPQAAAREPYLVGALALAMTLIGVACSIAMRDDRQAAARLLAVGCLVLGNGLIISLARMSLGYDHFLSASGIAQLDEASLTVDSPLGFPRLTGSYLTPIGFAKYIALMIVLWEIHAAKGGISGRFIALYGTMGLVLSAMSLSKGIGIYFIVTIVALLLLRPRYLLVVVACAGASVLWVLHMVGVEAVSTAFRIEQGTSSGSYRALAWAATIEHFGWRDWLLGTGFAYWPNFLQQHVGFVLSDPHNYLLSIPGTYGVLGVVLYAVLAGCLLIARRKLRDYARLAAVSLLTMFFVVDAVSIPYVIGNTPITACIWAALAALFGCVYATDSAAAAGNQDGVSATGHH